MQLESTFQGFITISSAFHVLILVSKKYERFISKNEIIANSVSFKFVEYFRMIASTGPQSLMKIRIQ